MKRYSFVSGVATLGISLFSTANAQASQTWVPNAQCSAGLPNPSALNGTFTDQFGAFWEVNCAQDSDGFSYDQNSGTNGHGIYACFQGCDKRPSCRAFSYTGTVTGYPGGSGKCFYKTGSGQYFASSAVYAAANLISNGTPQQPVSTDLVHCLCIELTM